MSRENTSSGGLGPADGFPQGSGDSRESVAGHGAKSAAVRERAIVALLSENTGAAAQRCGVASALRRWMSDDEAFKQELATARRSMFEAAMNRPSARCGGGHTLAALMKPSEPPSALGAARP